MNKPDLFPWSGEFKYRNAAPGVETGGDWPLWKAFHNGQEQSLAALWVTGARTALVVGAVWLVLREP